MEAFEMSSLSLREGEEKIVHENEMFNEGVISEAAKVLARRGASRGGKARAEQLSPEERSERARKATTARWAKVKGFEVAKVREKEGVASVEVPLMPIADYKGFLNIIDVEIPCYVLNDGQRVIGRVAVTEMLSGFKYQGDLEGYIRSQNLRPYIDKDSVVARMVSFSLPEVEQLGRDVKGLPADLLIEVCSGLVKALEASHRKEVTLTPRQISMAIKASMFLTACAKVGLDALIDEATGYQYKRDEDALQVKLRAYLETKMRKWEKTFPEELWYEFARLTNWHGSVTSRPKYWGQLVMKLVYEYLDEDVARWLKENAPKPQKGENYHLWLTAQYGLKKLVEHIWMLVGIAKTCPDGGIGELKRKMEQMFGKGQLDLFLPIPHRPLKQAALVPTLVPLESDVGQGK